MQLLGPPPGLDHRVVAPRRVGEDGLTRRAASGPDWRRTSRGLYVPAHVEVTPAQRVVEAAALVPASGAVTGWAALLWLGAHWFDGTAGSPRRPAPVAIVCPGHDVRPQPCIEVCRQRHGAAGRELVDGVWVAHAAAALAHIVRRAAAPRAAAVAVDMAAYAGLCSTEELRAHLDRHPRQSGLAIARAGLALADENSWSPQETWMRTGWPTGLAEGALLTNRPVFDQEGRHLFTPDLLDPVAGVAAEYDGKAHLSVRARRVDLERAELMRAHGLASVVMMADDLRDERLFRDRVRAAYRHAGADPLADRTWTLTLPAWWVPTFTVEQRRALSPAERRRWLRHLTPG